MRLCSNRRSCSPVPLRSLAFWAALFVLSASVEARADNLQTVPFSVFQAQTVAARQLIAGCRGTAAACDAASLPAPQRVSGGPAGAFTTNWGWLREALNGAKNASATDRQKAMQAADEHLTALVRDAGALAPATETAAFNQARAAANRALARDEFRAAEGPTWFDRQIAKLQDWVLRLFTGMDRLGKRAPWLAPAVEWGCFALAAAGLLWFVRQSLARQALRISLSEGAMQERAAAEDWRDAVHCLFWAAIALMEGRRAWKANATRTPREYLRLLKPGSEAQGALRELTRVFERTWYGHGEAGASAYEAALRSYQALEAARPERSASAATNTTIAATGGV